MNKRYSWDRFFEGNKFVLICVIFTLFVIAESVTNSIFDTVAYLNFEFVFWTIALLSAPVFTFSAFQRLWQSNYIAERDYLFWVSFPLHYLYSLVLIMLITFLHGFFEQLPQGVYLTRFITFTFFYVLVTIGAIVLDLMQTEKDNKNLSKIQSKLKIQ